jgi:hypothetical protein
MASVSLAVRVRQTGLPPSLALPNKTCWPMPSLRYAAWIHLGAFDMDTQDYYASRMAGLMKSIAKAEEPFRDYYLAGKAGYV